MSAINDQMTHHDGTCFEAEDVSSVNLMDVKIKMDYANRIGVRDCRK